MYVHRTMEAFHSTVGSYCENMEILLVSCEMPLHRFWALVKHWLGRRWLLLVFFLQVNRKQWGKVREVKTLSMKTSCCCYDNDTPPNRKKLYTSYTPRKLIPLACWADWRPASDQHFLTLVEIHSRVTFTQFCHTPYCSLIPRPSPVWVSDLLKCAKMEGEGLVNLATWSVVQT